MLALDSSSLLDAAAAKAAGYAAWGRYLTGEWAMSPAEVEDATAHGLGIVSIYEQSPTAALGGGRQGATDAMQACEAAERLSQPRHTPIYAAIDFEPAPSEMATVRAYLSSFAVSCQGYGYRAGVYGGAAVVTEMSDFLYRWQAAGWSNGQRVDGCALYQQLEQVTVGRVLCDVDEIGTADYGAWNLLGEGDDVQVQTVEVHISKAGEGEAATGIAWPKRVAVTAQFGCGPEEKGPVGWVEVGGKVHVTARGFQPGSVVKVDVSHQ